MKPLIPLLIFSTLLVSIPAQEAPKATLVTEPAEPAPAAAAAPAAPASPAAAEPAPGAPVVPAATAPAKDEVKPAVPASASASAKPTTAADDKVTIEALRKVEIALKKQMMIVGMGCAVVGLLIGLMIGRATAPAPKFRRF